MPRIVVGRTIELHYQSPNEMVSHLAEALVSGSILIETSALRENESRDLIVHIPWLGREIRLGARVAQVNQSGEPGKSAVARLAVTDGAHDTMAHLREVVGRFRTGAILEESHDAAATGSTALSTEQRIRAMSPSLRAMLAARANAEERLVLSRDADPRVIEYLLKNPSLALEEVRRLAARLNLH